MSGIYYGQTRPHKCMICAKTFPGKELFQIAFGLDTPEEQANFKSIRYVCKTCHRTPLKMTYFYIPGGEYRGPQFLGHVHLDGVRYAEEGGVS